MSILPEIFDKQSRFKPWLWKETYGDTFDDEKNRKRRDEAEKELSLIHI